MTVDGTVPVGPCVVKAKTSARSLDDTRADGWSAVKRSISRFKFAQNY